MVFALVIFYVDLDVTTEVALDVEAFRAFFASIRSVARVNEEMACQRTRARKAFLALFTLVLVACFRVAPSAVYFGR